MLKNGKHLDSCQKIVGELAGISLLNNDKHLESCQKIVGELAGISLLNNGKHLESCQKIVGELAGISLLNNGKHLESCQKIVGELAGISLLEQWQTFRELSKNCWGIGRHLFSHLDENMPCKLMLHKCFRVPKQRYPTPLQFKSRAKY